MPDRYLVRVTGDRGQEIDSAETPARPSPPVDAVETTFPALRELGAYKVRIAATEDGRSSVYGWDVDGCMVTLRRGHGPLAVKRRGGDLHARLGQADRGWQLRRRTPATTGAIGWWRTHATTGAIRWQRLPRPAISPSLRARPG